MYNPCRNYLCTRNYSQLQSFPPNFVKDFLRNIYNKTGARYVVGQGERGTQNNTLHIQFYVNFYGPQRMSKLTSVDKNIHCECVYVNNGADTYCMKIETRVDGPYFFGEKPFRRNNFLDWNEIWTSAQKNDLDAIPADIRFRNYNTIKNIAKDFMKPEDSDHLRGVWIYGPSGSGKSRWVREHSPPEELFPKGCNKWWDGYNSQKIVVLDDLGLDGVSLTQELKIWTDRYGCILENKGGSVPSQYEWFVVTSQYTIEQIWKDEETRQALNRRFKVFYIEDLMDSDFTLNI